MSSVSSVYNDVFCGNCGKLTIVRDDDKWAFNCGKCNKLMLANIKKGYKYVKVTCGKLTKIQRLAEDTTWYVCAYCNKPHEIGPNADAKFRNYRLYPSYPLMAPKEGLELKNQMEQLKMEIRELHMQKGNPVLEKKLKESEHQVAELLEMVMKLQEENGLIKEVKNRAEDPKLDDRVADLLDLVEKLELEIKRLKELKTNDTEQNGYVADLLDLVEQLKGENEELRERCFANIRQHHEITNLNKIVEQLEDDKRNLQEVYCNKVKEIEHMQKGSMDIAKYAEKLHFENEALKQEKVNMELEGYVKQDKKVAELLELVEKLKEENKELKEVVNSPEVSEEAAYLMEKVEEIVKAIAELNDHIKMINTVIQSRKERFSGLQTNEDRQILSAALLNDLENRRSKQKELEEKECEWKSLRQKMMNKLDKGTVAERKAAEAEVFIQKMIDEVKEYEKVMEGMCKTKDEDNRKVDELSSMLEQLSLATTEEQTTMADKLKKLQEELEGKKTQMARANWRFAIERLMTSNNISKKMKETNEKLETLKMNNEKLVSVNAMIMRKITEINKKGNV